MATANTLPVNKLFNVSNVLAHPNLTLNHPIKRAALKQIGLAFRHHARGMKHAVISQLQLALPVYKIGNIARPNA
jgi:hypothetical protein